MWRLGPAPHSPRCPASKALRLTARRERLIGGVLKGVRNLRSSLCKVGRPVAAAVSGKGHPGKGRAHRELHALFAHVAGSLQTACLFVASLGLSRPCPPCLLQTAIMTVADLYVSYGDALLPLTDVGGQAKPLGSVLAQVGSLRDLCLGGCRKQRRARMGCMLNKGLSCSCLLRCSNTQVLLKASSNDKKFVIEEAQRALQVGRRRLAASQCKRSLPGAASSAGLVAQNVVRTCASSDHRCRPWRRA